MLICSRVTPEACAQQDTCAKEVSSSLRGPPQRSFRYSLPAVHAFEYKTCVKLYLHLREPARYFYEARGGGGRKFWYRGPSLRAIFMRIFHSEKAVQTKCASETCSLPFSPIVCARSPRLPSAVPKANTRALSLLPPGSFLSFLSLAFFSDHPPTQTFLHPP